MTSQSSSCLKRKYLSLLSIGTACSIFLQSSFCYSLAWANSPEPIDNQGGKLDEATLVVMRGAEAGLSPFRMEIPKADDSSFNESTIDAAEPLVQSAPNLLGKSCEPEQEGERIIDQCMAASGTKAPHAIRDALALMTGDPKLNVLDE